MNNNKEHDEASKDPLGKIPRGLSIFSFVLYTVLAAMMLFVLQWIL
jgi:hypothetical protein